MMQDLTDTVEVQPEFPEHSIELQVEPGDFTSSLRIPLEYDDFRAGLLGSRGRVGLAPKEVQPGEIVAGKELRSVYYFDVKFHQGVLGTYNNQAACRLVLDFSFQQLSSSRFKAAVIEVAFEDGENARRSRGEDDMIDVTHQPHILAWEPREFKGSLDVVPGLNSTIASVSLPIGNGIVSVQPQLSAVKQQGFLAEGGFSMHGVVRDQPPSRIVWTLRENSVRQNGIRSEVSTAMIISYTPNRSFAMSVQVSADVGFTIGRWKPVCGKKNASVFFDPEKKQRQQSSTTNPGVGTSKDAGNESFDALSLRDLTRLSNLGGTFL